MIWLRAFNWVIFTGGFVVEWGMGLCIDGLMSTGQEEIAAFLGSVGLFLMCCLGSCLYFLAAKSHNPNL